MRHVREKNAMYSRVVPEVPKMDVLGRQRPAHQPDFRVCRKPLGQSAYAHCRGQCHRQNERSEFDDILEDLQEIVSAALALRCAQSEQAPQA